MDANKPLRGRPKTLSREHTLDVAMEAYWTEGVDMISLNALCKLAKISKPGLYREFGNEDGLMVAVLEQYEEQYLVQIRSLFLAKRPMKEAFDELLDFLFSSLDPEELPKGCLLVKMRELHLRLGEKTKNKVDQVHMHMLDTYKPFLHYAQESGELNKDFSIDFAAMYVDSQLMHAVSQLARGENPKLIREMLILALSVLWLSNSNP